MYFKVISTLLIVVLFYGNMAAQSQPLPTQTPSEMQQVLRKAQEKGKAVRIILKTKLNNQTKFAGKVGEVSDTNFTITDQRTGNPMKLAYEDVRQIKQKGMSKGAKVALGIAVGVGAFMAVGLAVCYAQGPCRD